MTPRSIAVALLAAASGVVLVAGEVGDAAYPGSNGRIAFMRQVSGPTPSGVPLASHAIYTVAVDGTDERVLVDEPGYDPAWSPDGARLAFWKDVDSATAFSTEEFELFVVEVDGTGLRRLTSNSVSDTGPSWSPDGSRIAFVRGGSEIRIVHADGGDEGLVTREALSVAWSPDGRWLGLTRGDGSIELVRPDGSDRRRIARSRYYGDKFGFGEPVEWTHDGRIAFVGAHVLATMKADGTQRRRVSRSYTGGHQPAWAPNGNWVAYKSWTPDGLELLSADGSRRRVLTDSVGPVHDHDPDWQPVCTRRGGAAADTVTGTTRDELLCGLGGGDRIDGGRGLDRIFGGAGNDRIVARDGAFDVVGCGAGADTVVADRRDLVGVDCERIRRR
jgi:Tol biopolymer transport system component